VLRILVFRRKNEKKASTNFMSLPNPVMEWRIFAKLSSISIEVDECVSEDELELELELEVDVDIPFQFNVRSDRYRYV